MAFKTKDTTDLNGILFILLLAIPSVASTNINCNGKAFHCVNSTHFMICVDLGGGLSTTIDDFIIPCPPTTICQGTNHFECEFPVVLPLETTSIVNTEMTANVVSESIPEVTTSIPFEEYYDTLHTTMLPKRDLESFAPVYIETTEPTAEVKVANVIEIEVATDTTTATGTNLHLEPTIHPKTTSIKTSGFSDKNLETNLNTGKYELTTDINEENKLLSTDNVLVALLTGSTISNTNNNDVVITSNNNIITTEITITDPPTNDFQNHFLNATIQEMESVTENTSIFLDNGIGTSLNTIMLSESTTDIYIKDAEIVGNDFKFQNNLSNTSAANENVLSTDHIDDSGSTHTYMGKSDLNDSKSDISTISIEATEPKFSTIEYMLTTIDTTIGDKEVFTTNVSGDISDSSSQTKNVVQNESATLSTLQKILTTMGTTISDKEVLKTNVNEDILNATTSQTPNVVENESITLSTLASPSESIPAVTETSMITRQIHGNASLTEQSNNSFSHIELQNATTQTSTNTNTADELSSDSFTTIKVQTGELVTIDQNYTSVSQSYPTTLRKENTDFSEITSTESTSENNITQAGSTTSQIETTKSSSTMPISIVTELNTKHFTNAIPIDTTNVKIDIQTDLPQLSTQTVTSELQTVTPVLKMTESHSNMFPEINTDVTGTGTENTILSMPFSTAATFKDTKTLTTNKMNTVIEEKSINPLIITTSSTAKNNIIFTMDFLDNLELDKSTVEDATSPLLISVSSDTTGTFFTPSVTSQLLGSEFNTVGMKQNAPKLSQGNKKESDSLFQPSSSEVPSTTAENYYDNYIILSTSTTLPAENVEEVYVTESHTTIMVKDSTANINISPNLNVIEELPAHQNPFPIQDLTTTFVRNETSTVETATYLNNKTDYHANTLFINEVADDSIKTTTKTPLIANIQNSNSFIENPAKVSSENGSNVSNPLENILFNTSNSGIKMEEHITLSTDTDISFMQPFLSAEQNILTVTPWNNIESATKSTYSTLENTITQTSSEQFSASTTLNIENDILQTQTGSVSFSTTSDKDAETIDKTLMIEPATSFEESVTTPILVNSFEINTQHKDLVTTVRSDRFNASKQDLIIKAMDTNLTTTIMPISTKPVVTTIQVSSFVTNTPDVPVALTTESNTTLMTSNINNTIQTPTKSFENESVNTPAITTEVYEESFNYDIDTNKVTKKSTTDLEGTTIISLVNDEQNVTQGSSLENLFVTAQGFGTISPNDARETVSNDLNSQTTTLDDVKKTIVSYTPQIRTTNTVGLITANGDQVPISVTEKPDRVLGNNQEIKRTQVSSFMPNIVTEVFSSAITNRVHLEINDDIVGALSSTTSGKKLIKQEFLETTEALVSFSIDKNNEFVNDIIGLSFNTAQQTKMFKDETKANVEISKKNFESISAVTKIPTATKTASTKNMLYLESNVETQISEHATTEKMSPTDLGAPIEQTVVTDVLVENNVHNEKTHSGFFLSNTKQIDNSAIKNETDSEKPSINNEEQNMKTSLTPSTDSKMQKEKAQTHIKSQEQITLRVSEGLELSLPLISYVTNGTRVVNNQEQTTTRVFSTTSRNVNMSTAVSTRTKVLVKNDTKNENTHSELVLTTSKSFYDIMVDNKNHKIKNNYDSDPEKESDKSIHDAEKVRLSAMDSSMSLINNSNTAENTHNNTAKNHNSITLAGNESNGFEQKNTAALEKSLKTVTEPIKLNISENNVERTKVANNEYNKTNHASIENSTRLSSGSFTSNIISKDQNKTTLKMYGTTVTSNIQPSTTSYSSIRSTAVNDRHTTKFPISESTTPKKTSYNFNCKQKQRGRFSDKKDCRKFYICIGRDHQPINGTCPVNTVFSEIRKQCTKNLSHCVRNNQFQCVTEGRFSDFLNDNLYYICVKYNLHSFIRFTLQCQNGYHLNKASVRCVLNEISSQSESNGESSKNNTDQSVSSKEKEKRFKCKKKGVFADPSDCRRYFVCTETDKSGYRQRRKKCDSEEVFHTNKKKCVDADSYECN